jgi:carbamate kinase
MRIVVALGGNALLPKGSKGTAEEQRRAAKAALRKLSPIFNSHEAALTHGNGPQVGSLLMQQHSTRSVPEMPLDVLDAMTQGEIGYFIQSALPKSVALLTRVVVSEADHAFRRPTKPIGPFYRKKSKGMAMDSGRGYRLVVPSPRALEIIEKDAIISLMRSGYIVICGGGGGIPVTKSGKGVEAVIDKDDFSSLLASTIKADLLLFITSIDSAYTGFAGSRKPIRKARLREIMRLNREGEFAEGSMKPKIEAAIRFIEKGGKKAIICSIENVRESLAGKSGTTLSR